MDRRLLTPFCALMLLATATTTVSLLTGCDRPSGPEPGSPSGESLTLPVSLNAVMVALVNHAADPIWRAAWRNPETEKDWRNLTRMAYQLEVAGALLVIPGNGPEDANWAADPQWRTWAGKLQAAGSRAVAAAEARDIEAIARSGDEIVDVCEGCHIDFKPDLPTGSMFGELSETPADYEGTPER
jgi:hypothetical protein